ncbi:MAG: glycosyltransferase family 92 protein [Chlamydiota bacterium]
MSIFIGNLFAYEFTIAAMFRDEAPYFKEWIEYHLMVGTEHFWLYDNLSQDNWQEVLEPYIEKGVVEVIPWQEADFSIEKKETFPFALQANMVKDALTRAKGKAKWVAIIDIDEFIFPKKDKTIPECLENHFSAAQAVFVSWLNFGTSGAHVAKGEPILEHLTRCSMRSYQKNGNGKSIWRPEEVDLDSIHWVHWANLKEGSTYVNGDGKSVILEGEGANWDWALHDKYIRINHYFLRDENFFHEKRLGLAQRGEGVYSEEVLWGFHDLLSRVKDDSLINFLKKEYPDKYKEFWRKSG